jgi:hypothetical protein
MNKRQLIDAIRGLNQHAETGFLEQFAEVDLAEYLERLQGAANRNVRLTSWVKKPQRDYRMVS